MRIISEWSGAYWFVLRLLLDVGLDHVDSLVAHVPVLEGLEVHQNLAHCFQTHLLIIYYCIAFMYSGFQSSVTL